MSFKLSSSSVLAVSIGLSVIYSLHVKKSEAKPFKMIAYYLQMLKDLRSSIKSAFLPF